MFSCTIGQKLVAHVVICRYVSSERQSDLVIVFLFFFIFYNLNEWLILKTQECHLLSWISGFSWSKVEELASKLGHLLTWQRSAGAELQLPPSLYTRPGPRSSPIPVYTTNQTHSLFLLSMEPAWTWKVFEPTSVPSSRLNSSNI